MYEERGVSSDKQDVYEAVNQLDLGPLNTFCRVLPDVFGGTTDYLVQHTDGAGSKSSLAYIYWKETGDLSVWSGICQDALIMNIDDLCCIGATTDFLLTSNIARNKVCFLVSDMTEENTRKCSVIIDTWISRQSNMVDILGYKDSASWRRDSRFRRVG